MLEELTKKLLGSEHAPKGDPANDLKTALFLTACRHRLNFNNIKTMGMFPYLLGDAGYRGAVGRMDEDHCKELLAELTQEGALIDLGRGYYVRPEALETVSTKVRAKKSTEISYSAQSGGYLSSFKPTEDSSYIYFVEDNKGNQYNLAAPFIILPGDEVEASISTDLNLAVFNKLISKRQAVLGRIMQLEGDKRVSLMVDEPNLQGINFKFADRAAVGEARPGDVVIAEITERDSSCCRIRTKSIVKDLGSLNDKIVMAVLRHDIPCTWPKNLLKSLSRIPDEVSAKDWKGRTDLRELPLVTIDGEDSRDFDDAVCAVAEENGWRLYVAIADVSYYVKGNTLLDKEALNRCNSVYFPNYVIPMLPEKLSNGICSLNPNVDRLCMVCEMQINKQGKIENYTFYPAVMNSHARLTYNEVWQMLTEGKAGYPEHNARIPEIKVLYDLYKALRKARDQRGAVDIESEEVQFIFNEELKLSGIKPLIRNDAHKIIEECMVAANVCAASFVVSKEAKTLFRIHAKPQPKKLAVFRAYLSRLGLDLPGGDEPSSQDYAKFARSIAKREDKAVIGELMLRSMSRAEYSPDNIGHFGLALQNYAHFTSPIRRYPDLQLHRVIKYLLEKEQKREWGRIGSRLYKYEELMVLGTRCSEREVAADMAEIEVDTDLKCEYLKQFIGEEVDGTITACTKFGLFVRLNQFYVDGLVFIGDLDGYMTYDEKAQALISEFGKVYAIGQPIRVLVAAVHTDTRKIDLLPANQASKAMIKNDLRDQEKARRKKQKAASEEPQPETKPANYKSPDELFGILMGQITNAKAEPEDEVLRDQINEDAASLMDHGDRYAKRSYGKYLDTSILTASGSKKKKRKSKRNQKFKR